jgi:ABC-2 type transport system ATP-binding protein
LGVTIGSQVALSGIDLEIHPGMIAAVVGGDGAGKTTLVRVLGRLIRPTSGRVSLPARLDVGYQPSASGSWPDLTVTENLRFVADAHRMSSGDARKRLDELLAATGLESASGRLASQLSGGMRQKLGVAMALVARPLLLVLDEPTTGVDPVSRSELWRLLSKAAAQGAAVVFTTTYLDESERAAHILALESGTTLVEGPPDSIRDSLAGQVWRTPDKPDSPYRWRRGREWREWTADGSPPAAGTPLEPDLTDLLTAATLARDGHLI